MNDQWKGPPPTGAGYDKPPPAHPSYAPPIQAYAQPPTNTLAIVSLIFGILWIFWIGSLVAVITGHMATGQIDRSEGREGGRGLAVAGLVLGWIGIGPVALILALGILGSGQ
jgi:hypothetical protein